jgi:transcriptional regulator with PAS, ATPase and Fis domain
MDRLYLYSLVPVVAVALLLFFSSALQVRGARGLSLYCLAVAAWSGGHMLIAFPSTESVGQRLVAGGGFVVASFLHAAHDLLGERALEIGEVLPVGAQRSVHVDVRLVSATNRNLEELREAGALRDDLYWRIRGAEVGLPPLRERSSDVVLLAAFFLQQCAALASDGRPRRLSSEAEAALLEHDWPGNLRELRHEMQRATVFAGERLVLQPADFGFVVQQERSARAEKPGTVQDKLDALERREVELALGRFHGNRTRAAEALGLSRQGLLNKLNRFGLG